jgi:hypothetical protein
MLGRGSPAPLPLLLLLSSGSASWTPGAGGASSALAPSLPTRTVCLYFAFTHSHTQAHTLSHTHTRTHTQEERLKTYKLFKEGSKRILVATDLVGRGIDIERVNIVINYDMPETDDQHGNGADTYLHRVRKRGRCFRGAKGPNSARREREREGGGKRGRHDLAAPTCSPILSLFLFLSSIS